MTIVLGYIPTPEGEAALSQAVTEARIREAELVVVNASRHDSYIDGRYVQDADWEALGERIRAMGVRVRLVHPGAHHDPATELIEAAEEHHAELLVIGLRRRSAVGKLLMGSTSQRVLLEAGCPVLAVKP